MFRFLTLCAFLLFAMPCFGWHVNTHLQMTRDAISLLPPDFQKVFTDHQKFVEAGIKDPDEVMKDWANHYYVPSAPSEGGAIDRIDKLVGVVQNKIKTGNTFDISRQLTYIGHYVADLWTPEYLIKQATNPDQFYTRDNEIVVFFLGYKKPIENFREYFLLRSQWRWKIENSRQVQSLLYSEAVNDMVRTWMTLWEMSGKTSEPLQMAAIVHQQGALKINFERMLMEEKNSWDMWNVEGDYMDKYQSHYDEVERLSANVAPSDEALAAQAKLRNKQAQMSKLSPEAPFSMLETSLKVVGDKSFLITRVRNKGEQEIVSLALMYPGIKGPIAQTDSLKPGQVALMEAELPANASKDNIQVVFATAN